MDENVDCIIVNVFCGDLRADNLAYTIRDAYQSKLISKKMVCRIKGNESEACNQILSEMNEDRITIEQDFEKACANVIDISNQLRDEKLTEEEEKLRSAIKAKRERSEKN